MGRGKQHELEKTGRIDPEGSLTRSEAFELLKEISSQAARLSKLETAIEQIKTLRRFSVYIGEFYLEDCQTNSGKWLLRDDLHKILKEVDE